MHQTMDVPDPHPTFDHFNCSVYMGWPRRHHVYNSDRRHVGGILIAAAQRRKLANACQLIYTRRV